MSPLASGSRASAGQPDVVEHDLAGRGRPQRHLVPDLAGRDAGRVHRHDETAHALLGAGPDHRDVGDRRVGDPHLAAGAGPSRRRRGGPGSSSTPGRSRGRARSGRSSRSRRRPPSAGSQRCFCSSEPNRQIAYIASEPCTQTRSGRPSRPPPAPGRPARTRRRRRRRSRTRSGACRAGRACRTRLASSRTGTRPSSYQSRDVRAHLVVDDLADDGADLPLLVAERRVEVEQIERRDTVHAANLRFLGLQSLAHSEASTSTRAWIWLRCCSAARSARCRPSSR